MPVMDTNRTRGWPAIRAPTGSPWPATMLITPGGNTSEASSASRSVVRGVISDGFRTTVLPAASAGAIFQAAIISG